MDSWLSLNKYSKTTANPGIIYQNTHAICNNHLLPRATALQPVSEPARLITAHSHSNDTLTFGVGWNTKGYSLCLSVCVCVSVEIGEGKSTSVYICMCAHLC